MTHAEKSKNVKFNPLSLFDIALNFVSSNVHNFETLKGLPKLIGEQIFNRYVEFYEMGSHLTKVHNDALVTFTESYGSLVLEELNLSNSLIFINEYLNSFIVMSRHITGLCLCNCDLGGNRGILENISNLSCLEILCLRRNNLKNGSIRKMTLPMILFDKGPKNLNVLDLAYNQLSDGVIPWISVFAKLRTINLTDSKLTAEGEKIMEKDYGFTKQDVVLNFFYKHCVQTKGWAAGLIEMWNAELLEPKCLFPYDDEPVVMELSNQRYSGRQNRKIKEYCFSRKSSFPEAFHREANEHPLIFHRSIQTKLEDDNNRLFENLTKKPFLNKDYDREIIQKDIFLQYL